MTDLRMRGLVLAALLAASPVSAEVFPFDVHAEDLVNDGVLDFFTDYFLVAQCSIEIDDDALQPNARIDFRSTEFLALSCSIPGAAATYDFQYTGPGSADQYEGDLFPNEGDFGIQLDGSARPKRVYGVTLQGDEIQTGGVGFYDSNGDMSRFGSSTSYLYLNVSTGDANPRVVLLEPATIGGIERPPGSIFRADEVPDGIDLRTLNGAFQFEEGSTTPDGMPINPPVDLDGFVSFESGPDDDKLAFVFINGIFTDDAGAEYQARVLEGSIRGDLESTLTGDEVFYRLHNPSSAADLFEVVELKRREPSLFPVDANARDLLFNPRVSEVARRTVEVELSVAAARPLAGDLAVTWAGLVTEQLLDKGYKVVLTPYSQGGLYANALYTQLNPDDRPNLRILSIATPASVVIQGNDYVNDRNDMIIAVPSGLPTNSCNLARENSNGHSLVFDYLPGFTDSRMKIASKLESLVNVLRGDQPSSATHTC